MMRDNHATCTAATCRVVQVGELEAERDTALARIRTLEAGLRVALASDGHLYPCPAEVGSGVPRDCSIRCHAARAALAGEG